MRVLPTTTRTLIERMSLFHGLAHPTIARIAALATRRVFEDDAVVFMRGDPGDSLYAVVSGRVRISASGRGGKEVFLNIMEPGDAFGEIALLDGSPRTATATVMARTELMIIQRRPFFELLRTEPQLVAHLIQLLCRRVRWTAEMMEDSALLSLPARLAKRLLSLARLHGQHTPTGTKLRISQEELAQFLGLSRQIVNQHLRTWSDRSWIATGRGNVTITNVRALKNMTHES